MRPAFIPGDVVQLNDDDTFMTVERVDDDAVHCVWCAEVGFKSQSFAPGLLWVTKPTHDTTAQFDVGDEVWLRSGGPSMRVEQGGIDQVCCVLADHQRVWLDARSLRMDSALSTEVISGELMAFAQQQGIALEGMYRHTFFYTPDRFIYFWRQSKTGVISYSMQGRVALLPEEFSKSASAFHGMWCEAGYVEDIEQAFALLKAWLLDRSEVDSLPGRSRLSYGIG